MAYVICEKCGGYYELEKGESVDDFDTCQCGGDLSYAEKLPQKQNDKPKLICSNCMKENEDGIFCPKCGGRLITVKKGKAVNSINNFEESKELEKLSQKASKKDKAANNDFKVPKDLLARISGLGVILSIGFYIISVLISIFLIVLLMVGSDFDVYNPFSVLSILILVILVIVVLMTVSGAIAAYVSKSEEYLDGALNGIAVGLILGVVGGILSLDAMNLIGNIVLNSLFGSLGGVIGIWVRKNFK